MPCCPYFRNWSCAIAEALRLCTSGSGSCVTVEDRCCGVTRTGIQLWETCRFYMHAADCRYCRHFDRARRWCKAYNKRVEYYMGTCPRYEGPRPVPSLTRGDSTARSATLVSHTRREQQAR